jgi:hypothetical protein
MVGTPSPESLGRVTTPVKSPCCEYARPLSTSTTSSADDNVYHSAHHNVSCPQAILSSLSTCIVFVPPSRSVLLAKIDDRSDSASDSDDDRKTSYLCPSHLATPDQCRQDANRTSPSHAEIGASRTLPHCSSVRFRLPYMTTCCGELSATSVDKSRTRTAVCLGTGKGRWDSQEEKSVPKELCHSSIDRRSSGSGEFSGSGAISVNGWRRPTLYRCLDNSQELKLAQSFDKFRHGSAK